MRISKLLKLMLFAALPLHVTDEEAAAAVTKPEAEAQAPLGEPVTSNASLSTGDASAGNSEDHSTALTSTGLAPILAESSGSADTPNVLAASTSGIEHASEPSAITGSIASSESGDLPNAAPAVVEQPIIADSALDASGSDTQAVEPTVHESLLRKIITVIERDFNMFSGELKQLMAEAKTHL